MKKTFLLVIILFAFNAVNAQNTETNGDPYEKKNEIKLNLISPLSGAVEIGFERYLNKNSSLGISAFKVYDDTKEKDLNYYISPYYRYYFGKKYASGFFAEGFGMFTSIDGKKYMQQTILRSLKVKTYMILHWVPGWDGSWLQRKGLFLKPTPLMEDLYSMQTKQIMTRL